MMFEFRQDTAVLQGAFLSAQRRIQLGAEAPGRNLCMLSDEEVHIVSKLVTEAVALAKKGSWANNEWEKPNALLADMRAHAAVFYTVLRSAGITCGPADRYYSALSDILPIMDWSMYVALLKSCEWSIFFLECINDIPDDASAYILESMLTQIRNNSNGGDYCIVSTVLEAILRKLLGFRLKPKTGKLHEVCPKFCFPFDYISSNSLLCDNKEIPPIVHSNVCQNGTNDTESVSETSKPLTFADLLSAALVFSTEEADKTEVLKVFLRGLITSFNVCTELKPKDIPEKFDLVAPLICGATNCIQSKNYTELISLSLSEFSATSIKKELVLNYLGWDVNVAYLAFLVCGAWKKLSYYLQVFNRTIQETSVSKVNEIVQTLCELLPFHTEDLSRKLHFIDALIFIADNKLIGINYALATFIGNPDFLEKEEVIACLERNMPQLANKLLTSSLLSVIMEQPVSKKDKLIPIFFHAAKSLSVFEQQSMLQNFLSMYGMNENLKQQNFAKEMSPILNQTVNAEQAEKEIILLCLQSPKECISIIIQQAVRGSGQIAVLVKMLKLLSSVCAFRPSQETSILVQELKPYFSSSSLTPQQLKSIKMMIEELLQVLDDKDGLKPSELVIQCVLPHVNTVLSSALIFFHLEVLEIVLSATLSAKKTKWINELHVPLFIIYMGRIIDYSIFHKSGSLKERVVSILDLFYEMQHLEEDKTPCSLAYKGSELLIVDYINKLNPIVPFYIGKCIASCTSLTFLKADMLQSFDIMWLSSCISGRRLESPMKEFILKNCKSSSTVFFAVFLSQVLPHLTLKEWLHSAVLLEDCLELLSLNSHLEQPALTDRNLRLPISIEIFVDALLLLSACKGISLDWSYMVSSFAKVVSNLISSDVQELHLETLAILFLELCRLASYLEEVHLELITVPLLDIFKILKTFPCFIDGTTGFSTCVHAAVCALPDCITRSNILGSMKT